MGGAFIGVHEEAFFAGEVGGGEERGEEHGGLYITEWSLILGV